MWYCNTAAIRQRRAKIESYDREMYKFRQSTAQAESYVSEARKVLWTDLDNITPSKCEELSEQCQVSLEVISTMSFKELVMELSDYYFMK